MREDLDLEAEATKAYRTATGVHLDAEAVSSATPDKSTIWRVLEWLMADSGQMPPDLAAMFDALLEGYKTKIRIVAYAVMRERLERIAEAVEAERELMNELLAAKPFMSNADKVKLLATLSGSISSGIEQLDGLAGVSDIDADDLKATVEGRLKKESPFAHYTSKERDRLRTYLDELINRKDDVETG